MYADSSLGVETPEGVEFVLFPAGPLIRSCAWGIDQMIQGALMIALTLVSDTLRDQGGVWILLILVFCLDWFYHVAWELLCRGQSPGKRIMGLRVVRSGGMPVNPGASFLRNLLRFADTFLFLYPVALVSMSASRGFRRLGDWVADTLVVYTAQALSPRLAGPFLKTPAPAFPVPLPPVALRGEEKRGLRMFAQRYPLLGRARADEIARPYAASLKGLETWDQEDSPAEYLLGVCCALRIEPQKIADQAIFYPANSVEPKVRSTPDNRDFCVTGGAKIHKSDRLLGLAAFPPGKSP